MPSCTAPDFPGARGALSAVSRNRARELRRRQVRHETPGWGQIRRHIARVSKRDTAAIREAVCDGNARLVEPAAIDPNVDDHGRSGLQFADDGIENVVERAQIIVEKSGEIVTSLGRPVADRAVTVSANPNSRNTPR